MTRTFLGMPHAPRGVGQLHGDEPFPRAAAKALTDEQLRRNLGHATATIRDKRARVVAELGDWEQLRRAGESIKADTMARLDEHLIRLEASVTARGGHVHWARDATEANRIVTDLVLATGHTEVVKVKSMATQEIGLNEALEAAGIAAVETDLAELIVQLGHDRPSHILVPAIHRNRTEIRDIFLREMPGVDPDLSDEPHRLAMAARAHLRAKFLTAKVAVSGANFAVAETGTVAVVESEGNGRMCLTLPSTLITVMGLEKVVPMWTDLEVFLQLLPRSSTGERMNPYTSTWTGVTAGDGPQQFHLVLVDNGRTAVLADETGRSALHCIRCSACLNVCPVYERTGGHAYGSVYPGPIGAILSPQLTGIKDNASLPYASSLCGACYDVCPVRIDIPAILVHLRGRHVDERRIPSAEAVTMAAVAWAMATPRRFRAAQFLLRLGRMLGRGRAFRRVPPLSAWAKSRDLPTPPSQSFRQWWRQTRGTATASTRPPAVHEAPLAVQKPPRAARKPLAAAQKPPVPPVPTAPADGAREAVLARIRGALSMGGRAVSVSVSRDYRVSGEFSPGDPTLLQLFVERLTDYRATVHRTKPDGLPAMLAELTRGWRVVVPAGLPWSIAGSIPDDPLLDHDVLDRADAVLTDCAAACAETGTIALDAGPGQGRRALTLIPDRHICVVHADQVVHTVPELIRRLDPERPLTLISGPSATSDIELNRVEGVHGPRTLIVVLVADAP